MKRLAIVAVAALAMASSACTQDSSEAGSSSSPGQSLSPGQLPTSSPGIATGNVTRGQASAQVAGGVEAEFTAPLETPTVYAPPPSSFALRWSSMADSIGIAGRTFTGTEPTSNTLSLVIVANGTFFRSLDGECQVTIDTAKAHQLAGSFTCSGLKNQDGTLTVNVSGRFSASG